MHAPGFERAARREHAREREVLAAQHKQEEKDRAEMLVSDTHAHTHTHTRTFSPTQSSSLGCPTKAMIVLAILTRWQYSVA